MRSQTNGRAVDEEQQEIIETLCQRLEKLYPVPEIGRKTSAVLRSKFEEGAYSDDKVSSAFVQRINNYLMSIGGDGHLAILHDAALASKLKADAENRNEADTHAELSFESERWNNFGFKELKILEGNVGYLDLRTFYSVKYTGPTAVAAMDFFSNCNGLIVDLKNRNTSGRSTA